MVENLIKKISVKKHIYQIIKGGAKIIDVGGESVQYMDQLVVLSKKDKRVSKCYKIF